MGQLFDLRQKIESTIASQGLDAVKVKGSIGLKTGVLLNLVNASTPDDATKIERLRAAVKEVLGVSL